MFSNFNMKKFILWVFIIMICSFSIAGAIFASTGFNFKSYWGDNKNIASRSIDSEATFDLGKSGSSSSSPNSSDSSNAGATDKSINSEVPFKVDGITEISIQSVSSPIKFISVDTNELKIHFYGHVSTNNPDAIPELEAKQEGNRIVAKIVHKPTINIGFHNNNTKLDVYIPKSYSQNLTVSSTSGSIDVTNLNLSTLDCKVVSGELFVKEISASQAILQSTSGSVEINKLTANVTVKSVSGKISLRDISAKKTSFETTSGQIDVEGSLGDVTAKTISGSTFLNHKTFNNNISATSTSGTVEIKLPENAEFYLKANSVSGSINSSFPVTVSGTLGKKELSGIVKSDRNRVTVNTVSGSIKISK